MRATLFMMGCAAVLIPAAARAQDAPRVGIVMGYPAQLGVLWNVSGRIAIRPELSWTQNSLESTTTITILSLPSQPPVSVTSTTSTHGYQVGVGASALFYLTRGDALRTYVAPRFLYVRGSTTSEGLGFSSAIPVPVPTAPITTVTTGYNTAGSLGAQYTLGRRFGLFGELGLNYTHSGGRDRTGASPAQSLGDNDITSWSLGVRSGVGVTLFF
jgi:hypothetical protein